MKAYEAKELAIKSKQDAEETEVEKMYSECHKVIKYSFKEGKMSAIYLCILESKEVIIKCLYKLEAEGYKIEAKEISLPYYIDIDWS